MVDFGGRLEAGYSVENGGSCLPALVFSRRCLAIYSDTASCHRAGFGQPAAGYDLSSPVHSGCSGRLWKCLVHRQRWLESLPELSDLVS